jgi:hypothetical protein
MLPRSWLSPTPKEADIAAQSHNTGSLPVFSHEEPANSSLADTGRPIIERATTAALSTPHDAVLAELHGRTPKFDVSKQSADTNQSPPEGARDGTSQTGSATSPEPVYDPFSGGLAYILSQSSPPDQTGEVGTANFEQSKNELWSQLGRIRELQSEIAVMHVQMEGIGGGDGRMLKKAAHARTPTDNILGEEWPDPAEEEEDKWRERDAEFANLAQAFEGRHASIDNIMDKVRVTTMKDVCLLIVCA